MSAIARDAGVSECTIGQPWTQELRAEGPALPHPHSCGQPGLPIQAAPHQAPSPATVNCPDLLRQEALDS